MPLTTKEIIDLAAEDNEFFARTFFPGTLRQASPPIHAEVWDMLENSAMRFVNLKMAREFAKTTLLRLCTAKRVAYGLSRTILYIGASEPHAIRSVSWLKRRIARADLATGKLVPTPFAKVYGLLPGAKWSETEIEIINTTLGITVTILGVGITGNIRGINFDDYRPDFIICDDILTDENAATKVQRAKITDLVYGAVRGSLTAQIDDPNAKMVLCQTPQNIDDVSAQAERDPEFVTLNVPCWTKETLALPVDQQVSAWEARVSSETLRKEKKAAIAMNRYSIFAREKEVRLVTRESAAFQAQWLRVREAPPPPMFSILAIDPVPPPSTRELEKGLKLKDFEVQAICGRHKGDYHVLDYRMNHGHEPNWSVATALQLAVDYRVSAIVVEAIAYQRVLKSLLEDEMRRKGRYFQVIAMASDGRSKYNRITSELVGIASQGRLWVGSQMTELMLQFETYPSTDHDDVLDAVAIGMQHLVNPFLESETVQDFEEEDEVGQFELQRMAP